MELFIFGLFWYRGVMSGCLGVVKRPVVLDLASEDVIFLVPGMFIRIVRFLSPCFGSVLLLVLMNGFQATSFFTGLMYY